jgi:hypothetical protein
MKPRRLAQWFALIAGSMDLLTGVGLVFLPELTLRVMQVAPLDAEALVFFRWVGAFVGSVGASYFWALARGGEARLRTVFEITALCRLFVGLFSAWSVIQGSLSLAWISVPVTDLALAGAQVWLLKKISADHDAAP